MESSHIIIAVVGTALVITAGGMFKAYFKNKTEQYKHEVSERTKLELSDREVKRYEILAQIAANNSYITEDKINDIHNRRAHMKPHS